MPLHLVLLRHGESEGNVAQGLLKSKDQAGDFLMKKLDTVHTEEWRLSSRGREQAVVAGGWLRNEFPDGFTRYLTSWYVRARETAGLLGLPGAEWRLHPMLSERNWGRLSSATIEERIRLAENLDYRDRDGFFWTPRDGESLAIVLNRLHTFFDSLHREQSTGSVVIVCHGEVISVMRLLIERMTPEEFRRLCHPQHNFDRIHNCQVVHFTRVNPNDPTDICTRLEWMRSVCPWDMSQSNNEWQPVQRHIFTNEELLEGVRRYRCFTEE